ncbi:MAG: TetR/AcrR family transcriptional regulator [Novosphingobium meiothermophilum]
MGALRTDEGQTDERTDALVDAAYHLLDETGLEGLTIRAVLARTGLARRAFYDRFDSKDELVLAVFARTLREAASRFAAETAHIAAAMDRLRVIVCGIVLGRAGHPAGEHGLGAAHPAPGRRGAALSREHLRLAETRTSDLLRAVEPLVRLIERELERGMDAGEVRRADPRQLATLVYNLVSTTVHAELLAEETDHADSDRRERLAAEIWEFTRRAIKA